MRTSLHPVYAAAILAFAIQCLIYALVAPFPVPFDEHAHVSYALHIAQTGDPIPSLDDLRLISLEHPTAWSETSNYLNHPSAYYSVMAAVAGLVPGSSSIIAMRLANVALAVTAVGVALWIGWKASWPLAGQLTFVAMVVATPVLPVLGGIVTNDNLAILGGVVCCAGIYALCSKTRPSGGWRIVALGFALASLAKLTAALLCGFLIMFTLAWLVARNGRGALVASTWIAFGCCLLALIPYVALVAEYGSPAPLTNGQAELLARRLDQLPGWREHRFDLPGYATHFAISLLAFWPPAPPESSFGRVLLIMPVLSLTVAVYGFVVAVCRRNSDAVTGLIVCGGLAIAAVLMIHFYFSYERHLETGWRKGIYPRYYLPLLPVIPAAAAFAVSRIQRPRARSWVATCLIVLAFGYYTSWQIAPS